MLSSGFNVTWLFLWQFEYLVLSVFVMFMLLSTLVPIYLRLGIGKSEASLLETVIYHVPFSLYLGWITIASIVNVAVALVSVHWDGFRLSGETWAVLIILVALALTSLGSIDEERRSVWAGGYVGIAGHSQQTERTCRHRRCRLCGHRGTGRICVPRRPPHPEVIAL